ncbi:MAG TPA: hypothetical protein VD966_06350, partial [Pyrinomonadaceae bacterium]|nr:hypothetical protein [Pyrinomonadaceae bacterium]
MKLIAFIVGVAVAAAGGIIAYRALFIQPPEAHLITDTGAVRELPDLLRVVGGIVMLIFGACLAFFAARRART